MVSNEVYQNYIGILKEEMTLQWWIQQTHCSGIWSCQSP